ncbi:hypothetical protein [Taibaiella chishuiensis]|uniref:16S rRNA (Cytosine967-C5)-methyltransferase n=1 Tax=Taibaiella chishuiensis TaxID=1434707 RepID=A0A2P8CVR7_9BACT|nr:hypothetical protein [Taibaiella chishuiensis]PSK89064.1 16S rRNA (cytosine967-C5)-methyltransferase [Taibaiella chishuiensis]
MQFLLFHIESVLTTYKGNPPLSVFLKAYFRQHPKLGSRDRKAISEAVYIYYRCASAWDNGAPVLPVIKTGMQLCGSDNPFLDRVLQGVAAAPVPIVEAGFPVPLSAGMSAGGWLASLRRQPRLFIRVRKQVDKVMVLLQQSDIDCHKEATGWPAGQERADDCLSLKNGAPVDRLLEEEDYVVQDWASQASIQGALDLMRQAGFVPQQVWDVCSGAGGKSILLKDKLPAFRLLVSDIRESILHNLKMRFRKYHLSGLEMKVIDNTATQQVAAALEGRLFDTIICDVPCSGSGTWARTPEQFHFFEMEQLQKFAALQYPIAANALSCLAPGGFFVYITCSVFVAENEAVVQRLMEGRPGLQLLHSGIIDGISRGADCMFVAVFRNQLP